MEDGTVVLIGATTENPSFELNAALLSRGQVLRFESLKHADLDALATRAEAELGRDLPLDSDARETLIGLADGDGRALLGLIEEVLAAAKPGEVLDPAGLTSLVQRRAPIYDKSQDGHYNLISALHKTVRGSDPDAALYYFARMVDAGEDPMYLARRLIRMAVEDIGMADPQALPIATAAKDAYHMLGSPEGELALAQVVVYLATAPKSNALYTAFKAAMATAKAGGSPTPPMAILNAPTKLMKGEGYGQGYIYDHDTPEGFSGQEYFPEKIGRQNFYQPVERGFEREIKKRMDYFSKLRANKSDPS
jgi:putative ATPase